MFFKFIHITYIPTGEGWLYLAVVKGLCTRKAVGYAFSHRMDASLTLAALLRPFVIGPPQQQSKILHQNRKSGIEILEHRQYNKLLQNVRSFRRKN